MDAVSRGVLQSTAMEEYDLLSGVNSVGLGRSDMQTLMSSHEERIDSAKGIRIFVRSWNPEFTPRGVVVICHGFKSHSGQYKWAGEQLAARGLAVYAPDLRGRGQSDGERYYVDDVADYVSDVAATVALAKSRQPGLPAFLLGHSAGGVTACMYALDHASDLAGLICESFAFQVPAPGFALTAIMHGTDDRATVCRGSEFFYDKAGSSDKTLRLYERHYHDLLNDLGKQGVMSDIAAWIDARIPASGSR